MKRSIKAAFTVVTISILLFTTTIAAFAGDKKIELDIPKDMVLIDAEQINPNLPMDPQSFYLPKKVADAKKGEINAQASMVYPLATTVDYNNFGPSSDGFCKIYSQVDDTDGFWEGVFYAKFSGYGQTIWYGTSTPTKIKSTVRVSATGVYPQISVNGASWQILNSSYNLGTTEDSPSMTNARHSYENIKIQQIASLTAIFTNDSYINLPGLGGYSSSEDTWWWF